MDIKHARSNGIKSHKRWDNENENDLPFLSHLSCLPISIEFDLKDTLGLDEDADEDNDLVESYDFFIPVEDEE